MDGRTCKECGKEFVPQYGQSRYCSRECREKAIKKREHGQHGEKTTKKCAHCGKEFEPERKDIKYCSEECREEAHRTMMRERYHKKKSDREVLVKKCIVCGKEFTTDNDRRAICSAECRKKRRLQIASDYKKRKEEQGGKKPAAKPAKKLKAKPKKKKERLVAKECKKSCIYRGNVAGTYCCDYILIAKEPRPCEIGKDCTVYKKGKRKRISGTMCFEKEQDQEFMDYRTEGINRRMGRDHRSGR